MRQRESQVLGEELLDVWAADVVSLLDLDDLEDLHVLSAPAVQWLRIILTWIDLNRDLWRAAMSWYMASTASVLDISLYSLYMLCVPERESYRIQMPKFLTLRGFFS